jgi:hypothetical protein
MLDHSIPDNHLHGRAVFIVLKQSVVENLAPPLIVKQKSEQF